MFVLKGISVGLGMFALAFAIYITAMTRFLLKGSAPHPGTVVGIDLVTVVRHSGVWFIVAILACMGLGISIVALWPTRVS
jgi:hypothetical protein